MLGEVINSPKGRNPLWSRRVDVLIGFTAAMALWLVAAAVYLISISQNTVPGAAASSDEEAATFQTAAGGDAAMDPLDPRVNDFKVADFSLGMNVVDVLSAVLARSYVENSMWPQSLHTLAEQGPAEGSINVFGADQQGVSSYVLEFCNGSVSRITERRGYASIAELDRRQSRDDKGPEADLPIKIEGMAPTATVSRDYQHVYDSGRTARLNIRYEPEPTPARVLTVSDTERCRREYVQR